MAGLALERALPATWVDEVFEVHRDRQYPRELMFSTIVELMTLVTLGPLRGYRGAALPGHSLVVYDPDLGLVCDVVACEDAYESERAGMQPLLDSAQAGQLWIADRHFCTHTIMQGWSRAGAEFIVREHARHPRLSRHGCWSGYERIDTGRVREQAIEVRVVHDDACQARPPSWRRIEIELDTPTEAGETVIGLWSNLPAQVDAATIAALYRKRWRIESMFQRLESVLHSEIKSLGHPRAALLGF
ncbi:transposase, partial [Ralstonia pseudosolanacearum]